MRLASNRRAPSRHLGAHVSRIAACSHSNNGRGFSKLMALTAFKIVNQKSIRLAALDGVPPIMVIAGPNGVGKSTLLYRIKSAGTFTANTKVLYQGPHRVLRSTKVSRRWLTGVAKWFTDLLTSGEVSGFEGLNFPNALRTPENVDEAGSTIKHTLGKIENRRQSVHTALIDRKRAQKVALDIAALPDVYEPLRDLTRYLLPHLAFSRVDFKDEDDIRCLWTRIDAHQSIEIDIDELSSGEKSIVVLFLPLIEGQIRDRLNVLEQMATAKAVADPAAEDRVFLIDEPEQHLHPDLQAKLLGYVRSVSRGSRTQFVMTTHSPTILDQCTDSELYVLTSVGAGVEADNQLRRVATSLERLELLKELAGSAYFLTTGRILVCIEGERMPPSDVSDLRLLEIMYPRSTAFTLVPSGGKGNVLQIVTRLRENLPETIFRIRVRGLVDADYTGGTPADVAALPVCMIENLLLDPDALLAYCSSVAVTDLPDIASINASLRTIFDSMRRDEIARRVALRLRPRTVRIRGATLEEITHAHQVELAAVQAMIPREAELTPIIQQATEEVTQLLLNEAAARDRFHGKNAIRCFYARHIEPLNVGFADACLGIAKAVASNGRVAARLDPIFDQLSS